MESFGGLGFSDISSAARRKRSNMSRRPRNEAQLLDYRDISSISSTPPSDDVSALSSAETNDYLFNHPKETNS